jgi:hypothetical protein
MPLTGSFYEKFERLERAAFHYGTDAKPLRSDLKKPFRDAKHQRDFLAACHRGFDIAQRTVVEMLLKNSSDSTIDEEEQERR